MMLAGIGLILSAFFSMAETVFITVNKIQMEVQAKRKVRGAATAVDFLDKPASFLSTTLVGTDLANILTTSFAIIVLIPFMPNWAAIMIISVIILIFGEILPKTIGRETAGVTATKIAPILKYAKYLLFPLIGTVQQLGKIKIFRMDGESDLHNAFSKDDLQILFDQVEEQGLLDEHESKFISNLLSFDEVTAGEVMTPRTQIDAVPSNASRKAVIEEFKKSVHSKLLVYDDTLDSVTGVILLADILDASDKNPPPVRKVAFVPESKSVDDILEEMQRNKQSVVVVVDEYGGTAGILTIEDIIEEIFGEFDLGFQPDTSPYRKLANGDILINGDAELDVLTAELNINFPEGEYETIAGLLTFTIGKIPDKGDKVLVGDRIYTIVNVTPRVVKRVILKKNTKFLN
ncbi:MAG: HlyC/CorC family transporter [Candidatus Marinimicrobia bacterium]|nr:HlyC/CorC family transporter [Candidatus Neomarinimicrobiota bacterium]